MKIKYYLTGLVFLFSVTAFAGTGMADPGDKALKAKVATMTVMEKQARFEAMKARVKEIKAMDKSSLTKDQRKALRMELRNMNKEARAMDYSYVYISVGGLILIILILILLLR